MTRKDFIPTKDGDFGDWADNYCIYLDANRERFGIPPDPVILVLGAKSRWDNKYRVAETPASRTRAAVREKNEARSSLEKEIRGFTKEYLTYNHNVTDADRENMRLPIYKTSRTPGSKPLSTLDFWIDTAVIRRLSVHFRDGGSTSNAKPAGVHGAEIRWVILDHPPGSINELLHSAFDTRTPFTLDFDENERGKAVYFCLRWESNRGDKGPWSEIVMAIIP
jgi:hypothetical protein